jgi:FkbM family methyltransferase
MYISAVEIQKKLTSNNLNIKGVFHIGAHDCEEIPIYNQLGLKNEEIIWIDAIHSKVEEAKKRGIPNVYQAVITDQDDQEVTFNISNNYQSSSVLEFGTHKYEHSDVVYISSTQEKSISIDTFFERNKIDASKYDFWNFDIQGAELMALKGASNSIKYAKAIYLEVNEKELYVNCGLIGDIDNFLEGHNFKRVSTFMTRHGWGDALYIRQ